MDSVILLEDCIVVPVNLRESSLQSYITHIKESPKSWPEQGVMHIGLALPMMYLN